MKNIDRRSATRAHMIMAVLVGASLFMVQPAKAGETEWKKYSRQGATAYEQANWGQAERMFKLALKEAEPFGAKDLRLASSLTNLGVLYNFRNQPAKAAPLFERAIAVKQAALGPENPEVIASVGKLCQFYLAHHDTAKADPLAAKLIAFGQKIVSDRQQVNSSFAKLSDFYQSHHELEDAEVLVKQAQDQTQKSAANQDLEFAVVLDGLGESFKSDNRLALAEQLYANALSIREQSLPATHMALAASCEHLAKLYLQQNKYTQAEPLFKRALDISIKNFGDQKPESLARIDSLATCYWKSGKSKDAETLFRREAEIARTNYGKDSLYTANADLALGSFLLKQGRCAEAATCLGQALSIFEKVNGPQHLSLSPILDSYAEALDRSNRKNEARKLAARAKAIRG